MLASVAAGGDCGASSRPSTSGTVAGLRGLVCRNSATMARARARRSRWHVVLAPLRGVQAVVRTRRGAVR